MNFSGSPEGSRLAALVKLLGPDGVLGDLPAVFARDPAAVRAIGCATWTLTGMSGGESATREEVERLAAEQGVDLAQHPPVEGPASLYYLFGDWRITLKGREALATACTAADTASGWTEQKP